MSAYTSHNRKILLFLLIATQLILSGCGARSSPDLTRIFAVARAQKGKPPLIIIPGTLGTELINSRTGEVVWPSAFRSKDDGLSLPITPDIAANKDDLVPGKILVTAKFARLFPAVNIYRQFLDSLKNAGGYREGDWNNPPADGDHDTYYVYSYDWRRDNVESARNLIRDIRNLKQKFRLPDLRFTIIGHSMGGLVARYAAMYGDTDLPPEGSKYTAKWTGSSDIDKILMFGTPNSGSMESFATLLDGYSITNGTRRRVRLLRMLSAEDILSIPAIFQLLPYGHEARFLNENLQPISLDLFNA
ncbi:MAG: esterase/lipase family protein, partial [Pyrinomonadaceae bacterium]